MNDFFAVIDLDKLADKLVPLLEERRTGSRKPAANEPDDWPNEPDNQDETDPWSDDPPARERRSQTRSAPSKGNSSRQGGTATGRTSSRQSKPTSNRSKSKPSCADSYDFPSAGEHTDKFDRVWFFDETDAPECYGGHIAARVEGQSQAGNDYEVWACPVGFGKSYKSKCDLWEYVN